MKVADSGAVVAAIGLGANLGDPPAQITRALSAIAALPRTELLARSPFYRSAPMGPPQPHYCNAVCLVRSALSPRELVVALKRIERDHGRDPDAPRWTARTLDLDLLVHGESVVDEPGLTVPHPGIAARNFVLLPLADIAAEMVIPGLGRVAALAAHCSRDGLEDWPALP